MPRESETALPEDEWPLATPDELVRHLREAGTKRVFLGWPDAFHSGVMSIVATYEYPSELADPGRAAESTREQLERVFDAIGDRLWFQGREWSLEGRVELEFEAPRAGLLPLYDRGVERRHGDGFNLRNLIFAYEGVRNRPGNR